MVLAAGFVVRLVAGGLEVGRFAGFEGAAARLGIAFKAPLDAGVPTLSLGISFAAGLVVGCACADVFLAGREVGGSCLRQRKEVFHSGIFAGGGGDGISGVARASFGWGAGAFQTW